MSAQQTAERLRQLISAKPICLSEYEVFVTGSLGIATTELATQTTLDQLLDRADRALYQSKSKGRNQVSVG
jgi:diguanylate cyclase (GGDEF)-like protein